MTTTSDYIAFIVEQLAGLGPVRAKRMFGGAGVYCDAVMFALISDDTLYFKADETNRGAFEAEGMEPFAYTTGNGRSTVMSYWRAPERLFDDPDDMLSFAQGALAAARRASESSKSRARNPAVTALTRAAGRPGSQRGGVRRPGRPR
jgi:DNA transformation protein